MNFASHKCLVTYGSSGINITHSMCVQHGAIDVDECYTLTQRDLKYTLLHVKSRVVRSTITSMMIALNDAYGIKSAAVFGYNAVSLGPELDEHPGMRLIADSVKLETALLECWMERGDLRSNRRGLLYNYLPGVPVDSMTRGQLLRRVKELSGQVDEAKATITDMESAMLETDQLRNETRRLKRRLEIYERVFCRAGRESEIPPPSP